MKRRVFTRICQAAPPITVAAITAAKGYANIACGDQAFGAAQIATAVLVVALTIVQARWVQ
jgi:hypothetical protein